MHPEYEPVESAFNCVTEMEVDDIVMTDADIKSDNELLCPITTEQKPPFDNGTYRLL